MSEGNTLEFDFFLYAIWKSLVSTHRTGNTIAAMWRRIRWSLYWLYRGVFPDSDELGNRYDEASEDGLQALKPLYGTKDNGFCLGLSWRQG